MPAVTIVCEIGNDHQRLLRFHFQIGAPRGHLQVTPEQYPAVRREDLTETLHGVAIEDPYRWLEDPDSPETVKCAIAGQRMLATHVFRER